MIAVVDLHLGLEVADRLDYGTAWVAYAAPLDMSRSLDVLPMMQVARLFKVKGHGITIDDRKAPIVHNLS